LIIWDLPPEKMRKETKHNGLIYWGKPKLSPTTDVEIVVNLQWRYHGEITGMHDSILAI